MIKLYRDMSFSHIAQDYCYPSFGYGDIVGAPPLATITFFPVSTKTSESWFQYKLVLRLANKLVLKMKPSWCLKIHKSP